MMLFCWPLAISPFSPATCLVNAGFRGCYPVSGCCSALGLSFGRQLFERKGGMLERESILGVYRDDQKGLREG